LLHKLSTLSQPRLGPPSVLRPTEAGTASLGISQVVLHRDGLAYLAEGPKGRAVRGQDSSGGLSTLWSVPEHAQVLALYSSGQNLLVHAIISGKAQVVLTHTERAPVHVPGAALALSGDSQSLLIADLARKVWVQVHLNPQDGFQPIDVAPLRFGAHEQLTPTVSLDATGACAVVMEVELGRVHLVHLDLQTGVRSPVIEGLPEPSWAQGTFAPGGGLVVQEMVHDFSRRYRLLRFAPGKPAVTLYSSPHAQPTVAPVFLDKAWMVLPLVLEAQSLTGTGPVDLIAIPMAGGSQVRLTNSGDMNGRVGVAAGDVWVQSGPELRVFSRRSAV